MAARKGQAKQSKGKKNRKIDRNRNRPSGKRYTSEQRWASNKAKRIARHLKRMAKKKAKREARNA